MRGQRLSTDGGFPEQRRLGVAAQSPKWKEKNTHMNSSTGQYTVPSSSSVQVYSTINVRSPEFVNEVSSPPQGGAPKRLSAAPPKASITAIEITDDLEDPCCICLEVYSVDNPKYVGACMHHFHYPCVLSWKQRSTACPMCCQQTLGNPVLASDAGMLTFRAVAAAAASAKPKAPQTARAVEDDERLARELQGEYEWSGNATGRRHLRPRVARRPGCHAHQAFDRNRGNTDQGVFFMHQHQPAHGTTHQFPHPNSSCPPQGTGQEGSVATEPATPVRPVGAGMRRYHTHQPVVSKQVKRDESGCVVM